MFALRSYHREVRDTPWLAAMAVLAAAILLMMNVRLAGASEPQPPRFLPDLVAAWEEGVNHFRAGNFIVARDQLQNLQQRVTPGNPIGPPVDRGLALWNLLARQSGGQYEQALQDWARTELPVELRAWKHLAMAAMRLERNNNREASAELAVAQLLEPENPLAHYYLGILHIQLADEAVAGPDYATDAKVRLVAFHPDVAPIIKGMYEMAAIRDLEHAIELAACFDPDVDLVAAEWTTEPQLRPTVADLLLALGAAGFESKAHQMLGYLYLERGDLEVAEQHLDQAKKLGSEVPFLFGDLGERYEAAGRHADAARAYLKAVGNGPDRAGALMRFFQNAADSVHK